MHTATSTSRSVRPDIIELPGRAHHDPRTTQVVRESLRLAQENEQLRRSNAELRTAAETWIRLYEAALNRANAATAQLASEMKSSS